jgi:hypothetical protein
MFKIVEVNFGLSKDFYEKNISSKQELCCLQLDDNNLNWPTDIAIMSIPTQKASFAWREISAFC